MIRSRERFLVMAAALLLNVAAIFPVAYGRAVTPEGTRFLGFVGAYHDDYQSYLAWIRQGAEGHFLFRDLFTSEPHSPTVVLPLFWFLGRVVAWTGAPVQQIWWVANGLAAGLLALAVWRFIGVFVARPSTRVLALLLAVTGSGLGWLWRLAPGVASEAPIDQWLVETHVFMSVVDSFFTLPLALALLLLALVRVLSWVEHGRWRDAVIAGVLAVLLGAVHLYDLVIFYAVLGIWALLAGRRRFPGMVLIACIPAGWLVYALGNVRGTILGELRWDMARPSAWATILGLGLPLVLAVVALLDKETRGGVRQAKLLVAWPLVIAVLLLLPIDFGRKLLLGLSVPLSILAACAAVQGWKRSSIRSPRAGFAAAGLLVAVCSVGSGFWYLDQLQRLKEGRSQEFASLAGGEALAWFGERVQPGEVILAEDDLAPLVPGATGGTVFQGHWAQTIDREAKRRFAEELFRDQSRGEDWHWKRAVLARNRVRWIVGRTGTAESIGADALGTRVWSRGGLAIWEVDGFSPTSDSERWSSPGWNACP